MINLAINVITPIIDIKSEIDKLLEKDVYPHLRKVSNELLDERLREGDTTYSVTVDGRNVSSRSFINYAKKRVTIHFLQDVINVGLAELSSIMSRNITDFASPKDWIQRDKIATLGMIKVVYFSLKEKRSRLISNTSEIENFRPGDKIYLLPVFGTQQYSNVKNPDPKKLGSEGWGGSKGWMGKTAANIRGKLKIGKRNSPIRVIAGRSRAALDYIPLTKRPNGTYIERTQEDVKRGAWVIIIEYSNIRV